MTGFMNWYCEKKQGLRQVFGIPEESRCICVTGAGGKTGLIEKLAEEYCRMGKKTLSITTTKIWQPGKEQILDGTAEEIRKYLKKNGFVTAGSALPDGKMGPLPYEIRKRAMEEADIVLAEADGSRRLPLKVPGKGEPVILPECDFLIVCEGMSGTGKPLRDVCHRAERAAGMLGLDREADMDNPVTVRMAALFAKKGYGRFLGGGRADEERRVLEGKIRGCYFMNQADCLSGEQLQELAREMAGSPTVIGSLKEKTYLRITKRESLRW